MPTLIASNYHKGCLGEFLGISDALRPCLPGQVASVPLPLGRELCQNPSISTMEQMMPMDIQISGQGVDVSPALHEHVLNQKEGLLKYLRKADFLSVVVSIEKKTVSGIPETWRADGNTEELSHPLQATGSGQDAYAAVTDMFTRLTKQARRLARKRSSERKSGLSTGRAMPPV